MKNLKFFLILFMAFSLINNDAYSQKIDVCGKNTYGQFGNGTTSSDEDYSAVTLVDTNSNWVAIGIGYYHNLAIKDNGTLWAWGRNNQGQLGDGTTTNRTVPTQVGTAEGWKQVAGGEAFTAAIKTDDTLWTCGENTHGQLGNGTTTTCTLSPTQIGTDTDWKKLICGADYVLALKTDSSLWAWGANALGQLIDIVPKKANDSNKFPLAHIRQTVNERIKIKK